MQPQFEQPTNAPVSSGGNRPWAIRLEYKSGKVSEGFAAGATPQQAKAGFSYYDKDAGQTVAVGEFTFYIVAALSGISGVTKDGDRYQNWYSSLVYDTRTQPISVWMQGVDRPVETGFYRDLKDKMPMGVGFRQVLICFDYQKKELAALSLTVGLSAQIQRAIGAACNTPANKISLFNLCDLSTQFWGIQFSGKFEKKTKDGDEWNGKGEMFFQPELLAGVATAAKAPELVEELNGHAEAVRQYVTATVERIQQAPTAAGPATQPAATGRTPESNARPVAVPADDANFPSDDDLPF